MFLMLLICLKFIIHRWDLEAMEDLPEYMRICYMALYNTTNEICYKVLKENGWSVLPYLKATVNTVTLSVSYYLFFYDKRRIINEIISLCFNE